MVVVMVVEVVVVVGRAGVLVGAEMERAHIVIEDGWVGRECLPIHGLS